MAYPPHSLILGSCLAERVLALGPTFLNLWLSCPVLPTRAMQVCSAMFGGYQVYDRFPTCRLWGTAMVSKCTRHLKAVGRVREGRGREFLWVEAVVARAPPPSIGGRGFRQASLGLGASRLWIGSYAAMGHGHRLHVHQRPQGHVGRVSGSQASGSGCGGFRPGCQGSVEGLGSGCQGSC